MQKKKKDIQQNNLCLKQQIYDSKQKFTHWLVVTVETFRRSAQALNILHRRSL